VNRVTLVDRRIGILFLAFIGLLGLAAVRAAELGTLKASSLRSAAKTQQVQTVPVPAPRGTITDRNGVQLAISESADDVAADPLLIRKGDPARSAQKLAPLLGKPVAAVQAQITKPRTGFVYLAHLLPGDVARQISSLRINGIALIPQIRRIYPRGALASQVLGTVQWTGKGSSGIEYRYDSVLHGKNGVRKIVNAGNGQAISIDEQRPTQGGKSVQLTIDTALQDEVEQVLAGVGSQYQPKGATAIVVNPHSGAILALANWPKVNPDNPAGASPSAFEDQAVGLNYEPGSTFKAITVAGALQDGLVTPSTTIGIPSQLVVADRVIHDAEDHGDEALSVAEILKVSSNIGADEIGAKLGPQRFDSWVHRFGFGNASGVDLPGEDNGIVPRWWQYSGSSMANLPFGQGESVTPMQMVAAYSAIANGGVLRPPHVVQSVGGSSTPEPKGRRIVSGKVSEQLRGMLRGVLADGGTASGAAIPGYDLSGKTGTANIAIGGHYSDSAYVASFIGFVPASNPQLLVAVVVNQPQGNIYGGSVAAPAFQKIVGWAVPYLGINPR
jgi:cell division protein FtsI (penicillin-binding protein 3)